MTLAIVTWPLGIEPNSAAISSGVRHGHRERTLTGTFGKARIAVPRARLEGEDGKTHEWRSAALPAYQRRNRAADALIAGAYLAGTNPSGAARAWGGVRRAGRQGCGQPDLAQGEGRLGRLERAFARRGAGRPADPRRDGRTRSARQTGDLGVVARRARRAGGRPKVLLAIKTMGGESEAAWRGLLDDLIRRGLPTPELVTGMPARKALKRR